MKVANFSGDTLWQLKHKLQEFIDSGTKEVISLSLSSVLLGTSVSHYAVLIYK